MIVVTRLNGTRFAVNPDLIERMHAQPDTTLVLVDGTTFVVSEGMEQVIDMIAGYRARVIALAHSYPTTADGRPALVSIPGGADPSAAATETEGKR
jgi:flagellar protein FlbD